MSVLVDDAGRASVLVIVKGAPEAVLARCADVPARRVRRCSTACSTAGQRVIAVGDAPGAGGDRACARTTSATSSSSGFLDVRRPAEGRRRASRSRGSGGSASR